MKRNLFICCLLGMALGVQAQDLRVTGIQLSLPDQTRVILSLDGALTGIIPPAGALTQLGGRITAAGDIEILRVGNKIVAIGESPITRIGGTILSVGDISLIRAGGKLISVGHATLTRMGSTILSLEGDPRVRLVLGY
jgi:hypothetical protein